MRILTLFPAALIAGLAVRLVLLAIPFPYLPDVYYYDTQAVKALAAGVDPYGFAYVVPAGLQTPGAANVFAYLPGLLLVLLPFGLLSDVRVALIACDVVVAWGLYALGGGRAKTCAIVFLAIPFTILFSTWFPNNALVGMAFMGLALAYAERRRPIISAVFLGLGLASSQFIWLAYPFFLLKDLKLGRLKEAAVGVAVAGAVAAPFLAWNASTFVSDTVTFVTAREVVGLVTTQPWFSINPSLSGIVYTAFGTHVPLFFRALVILALLGFLLRRSVKGGLNLVHVTIFVTATLFVLPSVFFWAYLELPFQTLLAWYALSPKPYSLTANP